MKNSGNFLDRLINKKQLYELPHQNYFTSFLEGAESSYEPDYDFIDMINN